MIVKYVLAGIGVWLFACVLQCATSQAQSQDQAVAFFNEAQELQQQARTKEDWERVLEKYENALKIFNRLGADWGRALSLTRMGFVCLTLARYDQALECYKRSLALCRKIGDIEYEAVSLNGIGAVHQAWGQYSKALENYEQSLEKCRKGGDLGSQAVGLNNIGGVYESWGHYRKAVEYYQQSLEICRKVGDVQGEAIALNNIGMVHRFWGQYAKTLEYYDRALALFRKAGDIRHEGLALNNIGVVHRYWGQHAKALEYHERALRILEKIGDGRAEGQTLANIARAYESLGRYNDSLKHYEKALGIFKRIGIPYDDTEDEIGNVYLALGDAAKARPLLEKAKKEASLGRLALVTSDFRGAAQQFKNELRKSSQNRDSRGLFAAHTGLGLSYEGLKQYDQAVDHYRHAIGITEDIRQGLRPDQRTHYYEAHTLNIPRMTPYEGLCRVLLISGRGGQAFQEAAETTKARVFAESIAATSQGIALDVPHDVINRDAEINYKLAAMMQGLQKAYEKGSKDAIESFEKQVKELRAERDAHVKKLRTDYPLFAATKYPQAMDLDNIAVKPEEWVVEYQVTETGIGVFLLKGKSLIKALFKPIPRKELDALVRKFREPLEITPGKDAYLDKLKSFDFGTGKRLSDLLLSDILSYLPKDAALIVIPDGCLGVLPFEMLILNEGGKVATDKKLPYVTGAEFFGDRNPISYYQSVTALTLARTLQKQGKASDRLFVMADPVFQLKDQRAQNVGAARLAEADKRFYLDLMATNEEVGGVLRFKRLALTSDLADSLKKIFAGQADCYIGLDACKDNLKTIAPKMTRYGTIVFATHGYFNKDNPGIMEPILALTMVPPGTDGFLRMSEIMGLKLNADIVALTACQTGLGRSISGEGTMGMGRAFQYAGAKSVLMSLWSVEQKASVDLVQSFFKHRKGGQNKLEALRLARQEIRDAGYDHPFFWAPFILVGEGD